MRVIQGYSDLEQARGAVLAIGNFDGVHRGHQALIARVLELASAEQAPAAVMVFEPHPRVFFRPSEPHFRLTTLEQKCRLFERLGLDFVIVLPFDAELAGLTADQFIRRMLVDALAVRHVVIGYDFFFGRGRGGNPETMRAAGREHGFEVTVIAPVAEAGEAFSSSAIRAQLAGGDVKGAAHALGHWWRVGGRVIGGAKRGTALGFPTANIVLPDGVALAHGIYAVRVHAGDKTHWGAAYLGTRPTFDNGVPVLEVFLFDFDGDLYGREIEVEFFDYIRADQRFEGLEALKAQMARDCEKARAIIAAVEATNPLAPSPLA